MPFRKKNAKLAYIKKVSNHSIHIKSAITKIIEERLRSLTKSKNVFDAAAPD